ncbi:Gfo/Idh/MocA family oxidoreductase [Limisphaera ngatamarikiensis]|jgi:predicted dehydrogenase|uniref:Gfo/Idh/MocA family oxidoreductase n=1 Tax=Limisphaera ngatamarikiensis TaxID=1324935 RepID=A0A6M1RGZ3_9BACT|nr:Gfo/Idh/MocA family oxidoreductase [Limisphaera ngatamarikiensis]NGO39328.1 Gfo/Idh/MocA family oxidoreductase [Limisphaera ngatamarikiensis]
MNRKLRVGVIGTGALGRHHARIYAELAAAGEIEFVGVHDIAPAVAAEVARQYGVRAFDSLADLVAGCDALSIVTPTVTHFDIARTCLEQGRHVLVEKPMTERSDQAAALVQLARERGCILQVGHVERFNPVFQYLRQAAPRPRFIEVHRLSPYPARSTDVGVVLDLMIHDLDVVLAFVAAPVVSVEAVGVAVLSPSEDIANARLRFANGCVANLTASRVSPERMRKIRVFSAGPDPCYISLDYRAQSGFIYRLAPDDQPTSPTWTRLLAMAGREATVVTSFAGRKIVREPVPLHPDEPLKLELRHFVHCARARQTPIVDGETARAALDLALEITRQIHELAKSSTP